MTVCLRMNSALSHLFLALIVDNLYKKYIVASYPTHFFRTHMENQLQNTAFEQRPDSDRHASHAPRLPRAISRLLLAVSAAVMTMLAVSEPSAEAASHKSHMKKPHFIDIAGIQFEVVDDPKLVGTDACAALDFTKPDERKRIHKECEFFDRNHSGNPLVKVPKKLLRKKLTSHYTVADAVRIDRNDIRFVRKGTYQKRGGEYYRKMARIDPEIFRRIEEVNARVEEMMHGEKGKKGGKGPRFVAEIDEGYRPYGENIETYMVKQKCQKRKKRAAVLECVHEGSRHISGQAVDVKNTRRQILEAMLRVMNAHGSGGVGTYSSNHVIHGDARRGGHVAVWGKKAKAMRGKVARGK